MDHAHELLAIECVTALFWNYTSADIENLKACSRDFEYVWDNYVEGDKTYETTYPLLWMLWMDKFSIETKQIIIEYAKKKYAEEKQEAFQAATRFKLAAKRFLDSDN